MTKRVWMFLIITFLFSWILMTLYGVVNPTVQYALLMVAMFGPTLGVLITLMIHKEKIRGKYLLQIRFNRFTVLGMLIPIVLAVDILLINLLLPGTTMKLLPLYVESLEQLGIPENYHILVVLAQTALNGLLAGITINAIFAFGEEYGWRGFLQKEFSYLGPWKASMIVGAIWGIWHAPIVAQGYNFPDHPYLGVLMMVAALIPLGVIMSYVTSRSGSIITAAFFHGVLNATAGLSYILVYPYVDIYHGPFGLVAIFVYSVVAYLFYIYDKRRQLKDVKTVPLSQ